MWLLLLTFMVYSCGERAKGSSAADQTERSSTENEPVVELALKSEAQLGEGAFWDAKRQAFLWVDILSKEVHSFDPVTGEDRVWNTPSRVGTVVPAGENQLLVALEDGVYLLDQQNGEMSLLAAIEADDPENRFNDGKCDPQGNLWVGSMHLAESAPRGSLYKVEPDGQVTVMRDSVTISNGIVWSGDQRTMYYIDTPTAVIRAYDYDAVNATIANERVAVKVSPELGFPDGMAIDAEDKLWVGLWNGNSVVRFDPDTGALMEQIRVPAHNVTACAFGGPNMDTLYITTARVDMTEQELSQYPLAGSVFKVIPGVKGVASPHFGAQNEQ